MSLEIIPAIIPQDIDDLSEKLSRVVGIVPVVQIDFVDGVFVSDARKSWPYADVSSMGEFRRLATEEEGLPFWQDFFFEADLMIDHPENILEDIVNAGFGRVILHLGSTDAMHDIIDTLARFDIEVGIAIGLDDDPAALAPYAEKVNVIQCMGIASIGKQHEELDARVFAYLPALRVLYPDSIISVDGGVTIENAPLLIGAGADRLVSGSAIFESDDIEGTLNAFYAVEDNAAERLS
ncbi:MAG: hypothetical protein HGA67_02605 [Candidatus Yonathbacteria bacterium]|nr:hypothetical protein [Candidatus Yonathbacteria bacterium]